MGRVIEVSDYAVELLRTLGAQGVAVQQFHPEYAGAAGAVRCARVAGGRRDTAVLVRSTSRGGRPARLAVSFSPSVQAGGWGNGGHLHCRCTAAGAPCSVGAIASSG